MDVVYFQCNANWYVGQMPQAGIDLLIDFVSEGGGVITSEWAYYITYSAEECTRYSRCIRWLLKDSAMGVLRAPS